MTLIIRRGDLFSSDLPLGQGVNTHGVMGSGIAVEFRRRFPLMYEDYREACLSGDLEPGSFHRFVEKGTTIYNISSQKKPGANATLDYLDLGLRDALEEVQERGERGIALPRIGCGIGGLNWDDVLPLISDAAEDFGSLNVEVWLQ